MTQTNAAFEAWLGLRAFPNMAPVKDALVKVINTPSMEITPDKQFFYQ